MSKGSGRRPGEGYTNNYDRIFKRKDEMLMLTVKDLDGIKLCSDPSYLASLPVTQQALENVFQQASQSWGVKREDSVVLKLASDLQAALEIAADATANARLLKGAQMELGRVKKQRDELKALRATDATALKVLTTALDAARALNEPTDGLG
jgi:hypothetical protein